MKKILLILVVIAITTNALSAYARDVSFTQEDRDRIIRLEVIMKEFKESVDKRFEQVDKRSEQMMTFMWMLVVVFIGITGTTIGFAIWDRRTMIRYGWFNLED